jgi:hypothetical protein
MIKEKFENHLDADNQRVAGGANPGVESVTKGGDSQYQNQSRMEEKVNLPHFEQRKIRLLTMGEEFHFLRKR